MANGPTNIEILIQEQSEIVADQMLKIAEWAKSEEDVRYECNKLIDAFLEKAGIKVKGRHEYGLAGGRIDSKYGGVIIEYKDPKGSGKITEEANAPGAKAVVKQIRERFKNFQSTEHIEPDRIFGVGCDADTLIFVRHRGGEFEVEDPQPVTRHTVERLLRALISLGAQGHSFTPDHLASHFGADSLAAREGIYKIYQVITETTSKKAKTFFSQWKILFGEVCGYDVEGKNEKIKKLGSHYLIANASPAELLFSVHTYYAIFMKFLAAEIASSFSPLGISVLKKCAGTSSTSKLRQEMKNLEQGGIWQQLGITNFLEGDLFSWYLDAWDDRIAEVIRVIVNTLDQYDPTTLSVEPAESRDLLKKLYQHLFPKSVRHDLGEYYTPDWLAELVLNELGYDGDPDKRLLDPACGSGTFLVMAINRIKLWFEENREKCGFGEKELVQKILSNIIGFDLNPLAVMAARTNYLLAIRGLIKFTSGIEIPVYLCDSIMTPAEYGDIFTGSHGKVKRLKTSVGEFIIPAEIVASREMIGKYADNLESCIRNKYSPDEFISRCQDENIPVSEIDLHSELYKQLQQLDLDNQNGIWARIIKNSFAPLFVGKVDFIAGNPPWINIENLPETYRKEIDPLWDRYELRHTRSGPQIGSTKRDICALFVYACADVYLKNKNGHLGFVLTQSLFKSKGGGDGFRSFNFTTKTKIFLKPLIVHDMSDLNLFEGAINRTSVLVVFKQTMPFKYPIPYFIWKPIGNSNLPDSLSLHNVSENVQITKLTAVPSDPSRITSPWLTVHKNLLSALKKVGGKNTYRAYTGAYTGGLNGAFWIRQLNPIGNKSLYQNMGDIGKKKLCKVTESLEPDYIYPLIRGRDLHRWHSVTSAYIIIPYDKYVNCWISESDLKRKSPKTYEFLLTFKNELEGRKTAIVRQQMKKGPFYAMVAVGKYTFAPWKVIFKRLSNALQAAVVQNNEIPHEKVILIPSISKNEAHFITALLNSAPANLLLRGAAVRVQTIEYTPSDVAKLAIPFFNPENKLHQVLAELSEKCHNAAAKDDKNAVAELEKEIDKAASSLWSITDDELKPIQDALKEMGGDKVKREGKRPGLKDEEEVEDE